MSRPTQSVPQVGSAASASGAALLDQRLRSLRCLIGNTPMLAVRCLFAGKETTVYAKFEVRNLTGSIKDRMALGILEHAYANDLIQPGDLIVEATSGNTGISLSAVGRALGHDVHIFMPDWMSRERVLVIESLGATVIPVSPEEGGFVGSIQLAEDFARDHDNVFLPRQFQNRANVDAHRTTTGPEILAQLRSARLEPTGFVAGVGTGGTVMGVGAYLREQLDDVKIHPLEPANSPTLRTGNKVGKHRIQGVSDEFVPAIVELDQLDGIVDVWDGDAILAAQMLARRLGLAVGISSGANLLGALQVAQQQGDDAVVATIFCDSNKKYLSTDLCRAEPLEDHYLCGQLELLGCTVIPGT